VVSHACTVTYLSMVEARDGWECQWLATAADSGPSFLELTHGKTRMVAKDARSQVTSRNLEHHNCGDYHAPVLPGRSRASHSPFFSPEYDSVPPAHHWSMEITQPSSTWSAASLLAARLK
jgi:hypothetical protein